MRVICINDNWNYPGVKAPVFGEECVVVGETKASGLWYYHLSGYDPLGYITTHFAPLSDIDETEFIRKSLSYDEVY